MTQTVSILITEGNTARVVVDRSKRLKGMFYPVDPDFLAIFLDLPKAAQKAFNLCWDQLKGQKEKHNRVVYVPTSLGLHEALKVLEDRELIARPNASQWRRMRGYTTVLINPYLVLTTDDRMHQLWELMHPGALEDSYLETSIVARGNPEEATVATPIKG